MTRINNWECFSAEEINKHAENVLESILMHPKLFSEFRYTGRFGTVQDLRTPDHRGARYSLDTEFLDFLECQNPGPRNASEKFEVIVTTMPDREYPAAEIYDEWHQLAEISEEAEGEFLVQLFFHSKRGRWEYTQSEYFDVFARAKQFLKNTDIYKDKHMNTGKFEFKKSELKEGIPSVEVYFEEDRFAELFLRNESVIIRFYNHPSKKWWELYYDSMMEALNKAKEILIDKM